MSIVRANRLESIDTTNGGIDIDASGHVQVDGVQMPSTGPLSNRNLIINGAMQVAQRGTTSTLSDYGSVDRMRVSYTGGTVTQTQEDLTSSDTPFGSGFRKFFRLTNTAAITNASTNNRRFLLRLEDQDIATSGWDYTNSNSNITLSMWVRSSVAQTFHWFFQTINGTGQRYTWDVTLAANTWTKISKTFPGNSNITFNNDNSLGVIFDCGMFYGTDFTDSGVVNDQWAAYASGTRTQDFDDSWGTTVDATFDVTGVQLEVGTVATPFEHRSYGDELVRCCRYYQKSYNQGVAPGTATNDGSVGLRMDINTAGSQLPGTVFRHTMRANPTVTFYSPFDGVADRVSDRGQAITSHNSVGTVSSIFGVGQNGFTGLVLAASKGPAITYHYTAEAEL